MPDTGAGARVVASALTAAPAQPSLPRRVRFAAVSAAGLMLFVLITAWLWRRPPALPALAISGEGSMLVVESQDGRRWIVGHAAAHEDTGSYVIVVPEREGVK